MRSPLKRGWQRAAPCHRAGVLQKQPGYRQSKNENSLPKAVLPCKDGMLPFLFSQKRKEE